MLIDKSRFLRELLLSLFGIARVGEQTLCVADGKPTHGNGLQAFLDKIQLLLAVDLETDADIRDGSDTGFRGQVFILGLILFMHISCLELHLAAMTYTWQFW